jgi:DNA topoisomerase VI subunit B
MTKDTESIIEEFKQAVNMTPKEIESWLKTTESKEVGQKDGNDESIGHKSGQKIIEILQKKQDKYSDDNIAHMKKVISYVHRHSAQKPTGDIEHTRWLYSLKNWGHDPLK